MMPNGSICHETWKAWRAAAGVRGYKATREQWVALCACLALHRRGRKVNAITVKVFIRLQGNDPMTFFPGLMPIDAPAQIPDSVLGRDLPEVLFDWVGVVRTESTIERWVKAVGLEYSRGFQYSRDQVVAIVRQYLIARNAKRNTALKNLPKGVAA